MVGVVFPNIYINNSLTTRQTVVPERQRNTKQ
jgi:hypothetical protein